MLYAVEATLIFPTEEQAQLFYKLCLQALSKAITANPRTQAEQKSRVQWHRCTHDQHPPLPCKPIAMDESR